VDNTKAMESIKTLSTKQIDNMYLNDFLLTWDKSEDEVSAVFQTAEALRAMRTDNILPARASVSPAPVICSDWRPRIWMKKNLRSPMEKPCGRLPI
jgi:hypothetical protein